MKRSILTIILFTVASIGFAQRNNPSVGLGLNNYSGINKSIDEATKIDLDKVTYQIGVVVNSTKDLLFVHTNNKDIKKIKVYNAKGKLISRNVRAGEVFQSKSLKKGDTFFVTAKVHGKTIYKKCTF